MRKYNARKTCKQHWLFKNKQRKLGLTNKNGGKGVFKVKRIGRTGNYVIFGGAFAMRYCFEQMNKILINAKHGASIGQSITFIEKIHGIKIQDLGLTRQDFMHKNVKKIAEALEKINRKEVVHNESVQ